MKTKKVAVSVVKGVALGVLWPAAATTIVGKRFGKWVGQLSHESLDKARGWEDTIGEVVVEGVNKAKDEMTLRFNPPKTVSGAGIFSYEPEKDTPVKKAIDENAAKLNAEREAKANEPKRPKRKFNYNPYISNIALALALAIAGYIRVPALLAANAAGTLTVGVVFWWIIGSVVATWIILIALGMAFSFLWQREPLMSFEVSPA